MASNRTKWGVLGVIVLVVIAVIAGLMVRGQLSQDEPTPTAQTEHRTVQAGQSCTSCHAENHDYKHEQPFLGECATCHTTDSWRRIHYTHANADFDAGMHAVIGCTWCHEEGGEPVAPQCESCHAERSPHGRRDLSCANCHAAASSWLIMRPLPKEHISTDGGHSNLSCFDCHAEPRPADAKPRGCADCHGGNHGLTAGCETCHDPSRGWNPPADWDHSAFFPLIGAHAKLECESCHSLSGKTAGFEKLPTSCVGCHGVQHGGLTQCQQCHSPARPGWKVAGFDHNAFFSLQGGHASVACTDCHKNGVFKGTTTDCVDCHGTMHGGLTQCSTCHSPATGWKPLSGFDHSAFFPLVGKHKTVACASCHVNGKFAGTPTNCSGCHKVVHAGLPNCANCHTPAGFVPSTFNHSLHFPITGKHEALDCVSCHPNAQYSGRPTACTGCHGVAHGGLTACADCHTTAGFQPPTFDHNAAFPLTGKHTAVPCLSCHPGAQFSGRPTECTGCHGVMHGGLTACQDCHTTAGFVPSTFDHNTVFPLTGQHLVLPCTSCHPNNEFANTISGGSTACADCHAMRPHGPTITNCGDCHTPSGWSPVLPTITHPAPVVLGPTHTAMGCSMCHTGNPPQFALPTTPCETCHLSTIPHVGPTDCYRCHQPTVWSEQANFTHKVIASYHAPGGGLLLTCAQCHPGRDYTQSSRCDVACHPAP